MVGKGNVCNYSIKHEVEHVQIRSWQSKPGLLNTRPAKVYDVDFGCVNIINNKEF
jgi:hypothetical protein